jgi:hypothetical protein
MNMKLPKKTKAHTIHAMEEHKLDASHLPNIAFLNRRVDTFQETARVVKP